MGARAFAARGPSILRSHIVVRYKAHQDRPMDLSLEPMSTIAAAFVVAGLVKGIIGMGLPSVAIALLALVMTPAQAAAIIIVPSFVTNLWQALTGPHLLRLIRRFWSLLVGSAIGVWLGGGILTSANSRYASLGLGLALVVYAAIGLSGFRFTVSRRMEPLWSPLVGLTTGWIAGGTGVFVIPAGPYFEAVGLDKDELVQMLGVSFMVSTIALGLVLWRADVLTMGNAAASAFAVLPALAGVLIGQRVRSRIGTETFRRYFFIGLLCLGLQQAIRTML
jgi:uncharacterized membrane protein YfcA